MSKGRFRAPLECLLLALFILVWLGPLLKLAGVLTCSWWLAFLVHEVLCVVTVLAFLANTLVGMEFQQAYAD
jgi:hypothetical protein